MSRKPFTRLVPLLAAVLLIAAAGVAVADPSPVNTFTDDDSSPHQADIEAIAAAGITKGCSPTRFCPQDAVTRGQMAAFLARGLDLPATTESAFIDTAGIFQNDINRLAAAGITSGCNPPANTRFCPDDAVTRGQMATFLARGLDLAAPVPNDPMPTLAASDGRPWYLSFADDFNGASLDQSKWTTCYWWDNEGCTIETNHELQWYQDKAVESSGGTLRLNAWPETTLASNGTTYEYVSGMVTSGRDVYTTDHPARYDFQYGFAEIRARIPSGRGLWPAFWLLPSSHDSKPEIDVMEIIGQDPNLYEAHVHYIDGNGTVQAPGMAWTGPDFSDGYHIFGVDWQPNRIVWFVDGIERWRFEDPDGISAEPMYILLNLAVGGDWPGPPDGETSFPATYEIDYVRVWQEAN